MKCIVLKENLVEGVASVERVVGISANLPILRCILLSVGENKIIFTATNLELAARAVVSGKIVENGSIAVPAGIFSTVIRNITAERVTLEQRGTKLVITTDNYEASIQGSDAKDFPIIPAIREPITRISLDASVAVGALKITSIAAQYSEIRPEISGVFLGLGERRLTFAATDSFRLAEKQLTADEFSSDIDAFSSIIPLRTVEEAIRIFGGSDEKLSFLLDVNQIILETTQRTIVSRLIDGKFPEYRAIIPKSIATTALVERDELLGALKLVSSFSGRANDVTVAVGEGKKHLTLSSSDSVVGENQYRVPTRLKGDSFSIVFNWKYLLDGVRMCGGGDIAIGVNPAGPVTITAPGDTSFLYLIMPIKS